MVSLGLPQAPTCASHAEAGRTAFLWVGFYADHVNGSALRFPLPFESLVGAVQPLLLEGADRDVVAQDEQLVDAFLVVANALSSMMRSGKIREYCSALGIYLSLLIGKHPCSSGSTPRALRQ
jgi:hypothetical protein